MTLSPLQRLLQTGETNEDLEVRVQHHFSAAAPKVHMNQAMALSASMDGLLAYSMTIAVWFPWFVRFLW